MNRLEEKKQRHQRRVKRIKKATKPKGERMRLIVNKSNRNISAQIIDDAKQVTMCSAGSVEKGFAKAGNKKDAAKKVGEEIAKRAVKKGIKKVYLDRRGSLYHGRIVEFATAARENGLEF